MLLDNTVRYRETKASSCTNFFCGEKWIKDALFQSDRYTRTSIAKSYSHSVCLTCTSNSNDLACRVRHSITSIRKQVDKNLFQLNRVAHHKYFFFGKKQFHLNLPEAQLLLHK